jgi:hypothetical protein
MADGATDLSDLLGGSSPVQNPSLPQSTTFAPIVTGGVDPFIALSPSSSGNQNVKTVQQHQTFSMLRMMFKHFLTYFAVFVAAVIISLPIPRQLFLQYIPNMYTSGGVVSYMGAGVLGLIAVAITYVLSTFLNVLV